MEKPEISPCPFCGSSVTRIYYCGNKCYVSCENCTATGPEDGLEVAILRWNEVGNKVGYGSDDSVCSKLDKLIDVVSQLAGNWSVSTKEETE